VLWGQWEELITGSVHKGEKVECGGGDDKDVEKSRCLEWRRR
jgi:hypothetical protein